MKVLIELWVDVDYHIERDFSTRDTPGQDKIVIDKMECEQYPHVDLSNFESEIINQISENE